MEGKALAAEEDKEMLKAQALATEEEKDMWKAQALAAEEKVKAMEGKTLAAETDKEMWKARALAADKEVEANEGKADAESSDDWGDTVLKHELLVAMGFGAPMMAALAAGREFCAKIEAYMKKMIQFANMLSDCTQHLSVKWRQEILKHFNRCKKRAAERDEDDTCPMRIFAEAMFHFSRCEIISTVLGVKGYEVEKLALEISIGLGECAFLLKSAADKGVAAVVADEGTANAVQAAKEEEEEEEEVADEGTAAAVPAAKAEEEEETVADEGDESKAVAAEGKADEGDEGDSTSSSTSGSDEGI